MCPLTDCGDVFDRLDFSSAAVVRVFEADKTGTDEVVVVGANQTAELIDVQDATFPLDRFRDDAAELGECALLVVVNVAAGFADELVAGLAVNADADLVGHRARWHEESGFFAEDFSGELLQAVAGRIGVDDIVIHLGVGDGLTHGGRGTGDGVGAEVDEICH